MSQRLKSAIQYGIIGLIGAFFLYFVFKGTDWNDLLLKFQLTNYWWIAAGMGIAILSHYIRAYRAVMLYEVLHYDVKVKNSFYAVMIGYMMNYIIPRAGEVSRCAALTKTDDIPVNKTLGTVVTERIFDMVILLFVLFIVFLLQFDLLANFISTSLNTSSVASSGPNIKLILLGVTVAGSLFIFLIRKRLGSHPLFIKFMTLLLGFGEGLMSIRKVKKPLQFILLSMSIWTCYVLMMYFCLFAMEATSHLSFMDCLTVFVIGSIGMIIPAPGAGAGTYHFAVMQSLLLFGVAEADGIAYATIVHGVQMILLLGIGAVCSLLVIAQHKKKLA
ncbi:MAG: lysylphosphatidylglycerol synthase transmembrane domain-containing protein [Bacteroidota bacterium]